MHVFKPSLFELLEESIKNSKENILLTPVQQQLAQTDKYLALEMKGNRYDTSKKLGLMQAQLALGLAGSVKEEILSSIIQILAESGKRNSL
jgi:UTP--glucose-1-phosphate uridylyltransferase